MKMAEAILVEDDPRLGALLVLALSEEHKVHWAHTATQASEMVADRRPELMVVDPALPDGDGLDLVARLRREGLTVPILILMAMGTSIDRIEGLGRGANDYVVEPFDVDELLARLRALTRDYSPEGG